MLPNSRILDDELTKTCIESIKYHQYGFSVIPLVPKNKHPIVEWKIYQSERATLDQLLQWFGNADNNLGIITGRISENLVVCDFDSIEAFEKWYSVYHNICDKTGLAKTSKGYHLFVRTDKYVPRNYGKAMFGDVRIGETRGEGGYIVAPPSIHPDGSQYTWIRHPRDGIETISSLEEIGITNNGSQKEPEVKNHKVKYLIDKYAYAEVVLRNALLDIKNSVKGERNTTLLISSIAVSKLFESRSLNREETMSLLKNAGIEKGLKEREVVRTINSGFRYGEEASYIVRPMMNDWERTFQVSKEMGLLGYMQNCVNRDTGWVIDYETGDVTKKTVYCGLDRYYADGYLACAFTYKYLAEKFDCSKPTISKWISALRRAGFVRVLGTCKWKGKEHTIYAVGELRLQGNMEYEYFYDEPKDN